MLGLITVILIAVGFGIAPSSADKAKQTFDIRSRDGSVLISSDKILAYDWGSHTLTLKLNVRKELQAKLKWSLANGHPFVVAIDGKPIYEGTITSMVSSSAFETPVIVLDEATYLPKRLKENQVRIALGYPGANFFKGKDPRPDPRVKASLKATGKLRQKPAR